MTIHSRQILRNRKIKMNGVRVTMQLADHEWVESAQTPFQITASHRPLGAKELQMLPEGQRSDTYRVINCEERLSVADDKLGVVGDIILGLLGFDWRVVDAMEWGDGNRHNRYRLQKIRIAAT